jgi:hypothetical protein
MQIAITTSHPACAYISLPLRKIFLSPSPLKDIVVRRAVSRQRLGKHVYEKTDTHAEIKVLLKIVYSTRSLQRGYKKDY